MGYKKSYPDKKKKEDKPKRAFSDKKRFGDKPAFRKRSGEEGSFSRDRDDKRGFRGPSDRPSRPDDRERKPFRRPEGDSRDEKRRGGSKPAHSPRNPRWEARPDWKKNNDPETPRVAIGTYSRDKQSDEGEAKPFRREDSKFGDKRRSAPKSFRDRERNRQDRAERTTRDDAREPRVRESGDARPDRERKPFRKSGDDSRPTYKDFKSEDRPVKRTEDDALEPRVRESRDARPDRERKPFRKSGDERPTYKDFKSEDRPERRSEDEPREPRVRESRDVRPDERERKPYRKPEGPFGDDKRAPRPRFSKDRDSGSGDGEKKWNRKSEGEFYGDRRKSGPRGGGFRKKSFSKSSQEDDGTIRLNKFISNAGICSRREADELIEAGVVSVNGEVVTQLGYKVKPEDVVKYNNETLRTERMVYMLLNKPKDFITTAEDPEKRKTVMNLIAGACKERVYPVGRLDRNTTGLLLMTNDGDLTRKLTHPSFEVQKIYQVELDSAVKPSDMDAIEKGIHLEDGFVKVDAVSYVGTGQDKSVVGVELHSGRNRIVRRIFEHLGYEVKKLDRVYFAGISKKDLPRGRWRFLTDLEVASLKIMTGSKKFRNLAPVEEGGAE